MSRRSLPGPCCPPQCVCVCVCLIVYWTLSWEHFGSTSGTNCRPTSGQQSHSPSSTKDSRLIVQTPQHDSLPQKHLYALVCIVSTYVTALMFTLINNSYDTQMTALQLFLYFVFYSINGDLFFSCDKCTNCKLLWTKASANRKCKWPCKVISDVICDVMSFLREEGQEGEEGPVDPQPPARERDRSHSKTKKTRRERRHADRGADTAASASSPTAALQSQMGAEPQTQVR